MEALLPTVQFVHFASAMALFGAALFPFYVPGAMDVRPRLVAWVSVVVLGSAVFWLAGLVATMGGGIVSLWTPRILSAVLLKTHAGPILLLRLVLAAALAATAFRPLTERWRRVFVGGAALLLASLAEIGHAAMDTGLIGALRILVQAVHLLAAGAWLGGLLPLAAAARGAREDPAELRRIALAFSDVGIALVALILATGIANAAFLLPSAAALLETPYGRVLCVKLALVALLIGLAALNRLALVPAFAQSGARPFVRVVAAEQGVGLLVLAAATLLEICRLRRLEVAARHFGV